MTNMARVNLGTDNFENDLAKKIAKDRKQCKTIRSQIAKGKKGHDKGRGI